MNTDYFPKQLYNQLDGSLDYFYGAYKAASHNFTVSTEFSNLSSSSSISEIADGIFAEITEGPSFDLKAKHFISHVLVGAILLVPILNVFVFMGFESNDDSNVDILPPLQNANPVDLDISIDISQPAIVADKPTENTALVQQPIEAEVTGDDSPEQDTPVSPEPLLFRRDSTSRSRVALEDSPAIHRLKERKNSRVSQRALVFEQNKFNHQQQQLDAALPILDGERSNPVSIAEFREIEASFTQEFFRLFPNETCDSQFAGLRKQQEAESLGVVLNDSKYIESFILYTEGSTPEVRFKRPTENLAALNQFILDQYPNLNFYILGNFKNDMQNKIDAIPYIHIIKILFRASLEEFMQELRKYKFVAIDAMEGEKTPVRIDTIEFQQTHKQPGSIKKRLNKYRNSVSSLK